MAQPLPPQAPDAATDAEIKRAYRQMSLKHHPDKGGDPKRFTEISFAYEVLSDGEKRSLYDAGGMAAVRGAIADPRATAGAVAAKRDGGRTSLQP